MSSFRTAALGALVLLFSASAWAQIARVAGTVRDEAGKPIKGATVTAHNPEHSPSTYSASTDDKGRFAVLGLRRGSWIFTFQAPGFEPVRMRGDVVTIRPNPPLEVRLLKGALPAPPGPLSSMSAGEIQKRIDLAESLASSGDIAASIAAYRELLSRVPALTSIYLRIGALHEQQEDSASALEAYRQLARLEPDNARALAAIARLSR